MTTYCYRCGEEREIAGHFCQPCLDEVSAEEKKESQSPFLSPSEAIMAMLNGEELDRGFGVIEKWDGEHFVYQIIGEKKWTRKPENGEFEGLRRISKPSFKLLKPPFDWFCIKYDKVPEENFTEIFHELRDYAKAALNEKYERDHSEPMKWINSPCEDENYNSVICPKCSKPFGAYYKDIIRNFNYCPNCGQKLDKPEGK